MISLRDQHTSTTLSGDQERQHLRPKIPIVGVSVIIYPTPPHIEPRVDNSHLICERYNGYNIPHAKSSIDN